MFQNERFVIIIKKTKTMVICRLILGIFGDFQNFPISRFQILENLEILWKWLFLTNCSILGIIPTQYGSLSLVFLSDYLNSHSSGISRFQIPENLEILWKLLHLTNCKILGIFPTQFWSLSLIFHSEFLNFHFPGISRFQIFWNLEFGNSRKMQIQKF